MTRKDGGDARLGHRHAELSQLADDAQISPSGILPGQAANELDGLGREHRAPRPTVGICPVSSDEATVPIKNRLRHDEERRPSLAGHEPGEQRNDRPVRPVETRTGDLAAKHCELVTEHQDLGILCDVVHPMDTHESECAVSQAVEEGKDHGELASPSELLLVKLAAGSSWTLQVARKRR